MVVYGQGLYECPVHGLVDPSPRTQADLDSAEQDLIVRLSQAYFEVLAAQDALATLLFQVQVGQARVANHR